MKYSYNWLKELSGTKLSPEKAAELLTMRAMELEGMEKSGEEFNKVVVGKILEVKKHPNADKLRLAKVDVGKETLNIVCGAPNIEAGQKVPVALVGAVLPGNFEIKAAEIRGEKSFGMLCAPDELGLGTDHSGIMILKNSARIGEPLAKYLGMDDTIFEIKVLPDRAHDALSHVGVAREISVLSGTEFKYDFDGLKLPKKKTKMVSVRIDDKKLCSRYIGAVMTDVEIKDSPEWMKARLIASGMNAINNVVDATNYVMLELGQPLHAFDLDKLRDKKIIIRRAKKNEEINLLDKGLKNLSEEDLVITEGGQPVALAGIKGARAAEIDANTKNIVLEAASFNATNIRRTRTRLGIRTESSDRYEKDIDPNLCEKAMTRLIEILEHTAGAKLEGIVDEYPVKVKTWKVKLDLEYVNNLLGETVSKNEIIKILKSLGIKVSSQAKNIVCEIPTFRVDMKTQEDLIEEIGRIRGYDKISAQALLERVEPARINAQVFFERKIKDILVGIGFDEMYNYSFYSRRDAEICGLSSKKHYELANPMSPEQELVRASMLPNILKNVRENVKNFEAFDIFEIGRTYYPENGKMIEKRQLILAEVLDKEEKEMDTFYSLKGAVVSLLERLGILEYKIIHPINLNEMAAVYVGKEDVCIGTITEADMAILAKYKITKRTAVAALDLEVLLEAVPKLKIFKSISKFPIVTRDISMIVPGGVTYLQIVESAKKHGGDLVRDVSLFDHFQAKKSLAIRISFGSPERTLESVEIERLMEKIVSNLEKNLAIEIRK